MTARDDGRRSELIGEPVRDFGEHDAQRQQYHVARHERPRRAKLLEVLAQQADHGRAGQRNPDHEQ